MPRRNHTKSHTPYQPNKSPEATKKRFASKQAALLAIKELKKYHLDLTLVPYQSPHDGQWYLTSRDDT